jgi:hypothetical protein
MKCLSATVLVMLCFGGMAGCQSSMVTLGDLHVLDDKIARLQKRADALELANSKFGGRFLSGYVQTTGPSTTIAVGNPMLGALWAIRINTANYEYRVWLVVSGLGVGLRDVRVLSVITPFNNTGGKIDAPTFDTDEKGQLIVKGNWPDGTDLFYSRFDPN